MITLRNAMQELFNFQEQEGFARYQIASTVPFNVFLTLSMDTDDDVKVMMIDPEIEINGIVYRLEFSAGYLAFSKDTFDNDATIGSGVEILEQVSDQMRTQDYQTIEDDLDEQTRLQIENYVDELEEVIE